MIYEIPIDITNAVQDGEVTFEVELDGVVYTMQLSWADCDQSWYMALLLHAGDDVVSIAQGVALATSVPLLLDVQVPDRPAGELMMVGDHDATRTDLGSAVVMRYYDAAEIVAIKASLA